MQLLRHLPNFLTSCNLFFGCLGIFEIATGSALYAFYYMLACAVFDFFDGLAARALKAYSAIGKDLDSLADVVSFGVLPGFFMLYLLASFTKNLPENLYFIPYFGLLIPLFSALRLAIFNNDTEQTVNFKGLPTPANALILGSYMIFVTTSTELPQFLTSVWPHLLLIVLSSGLLVSRIPLMSLKFSGAGLKTMLPQLILIVIGVILVIFIKFAASIPILILYIILSQIKFKNDKV
jgi:CDP-diacylglycerol--serine O-phosphatidyltransferase